MKPLNILFAGDLNFRGIDPMSAKQTEDIISEIKPVFNTADFRVLNLETPLADKEKHRPIKKSGPNLICSKDNISFLKKLGIDAVTLANNHIGDYGEGAVEETISLLDSHGISHAGAGDNIYDAFEAFYIDGKDIRVSVISTCENEFGMAENDKWGSAGYNPRILLRKIKEEKEKADYVVITFHGGNEFNPLPSPAITDRYRMLCDMGADAVIAGHTHCPQGYEYYDGKPIIYSMGNFLFRSSDGKSASDSWHYGYLCRLSVGSRIDPEVIPYRFEPDCSKIRLFKDDDKDRMIGYIDRLSAIISDPYLLEQYHKGWCRLHQWCPSLPNGDIQNYNSSGNFNLISCESHLDQLRRVLEIYYKDEMSEADVWAEKIKELQIMPV